MCTHNMRALDHQGDQWGGEGRGRSLTVTHHTGVRCSNGTCVYPVAIQVAIW